MYMMVILRNEYTKWKIEDAYIMNDHLINRRLFYRTYPEIIDVSESVDTPMGFARVFTFESEQQYHWFLLQQ